MALFISYEELKGAGQSLTGEITAEALDLEWKDELVTSIGPLTYDLNASLLADAILVRGRLELAVDCECARCLKNFIHTICLPDWTLHLPVNGEDAVIIEEDLVDLTPWVREDTLLGFPQHPLCAPDCSGLEAGIPSVPELGAEADPPRSPWAKLEDRENE